MIALICLKQFQRAGVVYKPGIVQKMAGEGGRVDLPGIGQVSPAQLGWSSEHYAIVEVVPAEVPEGHRVLSRSYAIEDGKVVENVETEEVPTPRPTVAKSVVQQRLIDAEKIDAAYAALQSDPASFARWFAPDHPSVYCDDPDAIALVTAIGGDPDVILAPEGA